MEAVLSRAARWVIGANVPDKATLQSLAPERRRLWETRLANTCKTPFRRMKANLWLIHAERALADPMRRDWFSSQAPDKAAVDNESMPFWERRLLRQRLAKSNSRQIKEVNSFHDLLADLPQGDNAEDFLSYNSD